MPRDTQAIPVQGPDNGSGNPIAVVGVVGGVPSDVNIVQVAGGAVTTNGTGRMVVQLGDAASNFMAFQTIAESQPTTPTLPGGNVFQTATAAANTAVTITLAAVSGRRQHLTSVSFHFTGANAAGVLTITDNATVVQNVAYPAAQNTTLNFLLPRGGVKSATTNTTMAITLPAGGAGVVGVLNISSINW